MSMPEGSGSRVFGPESAVVLLAFLGVALSLYEPVMDGAFVSDDVVVITMNPYVQDLTFGNLATILDPYGPAIGYALNYSPVHLLIHAVEVELFGDAMRGYHLVNAVVHALTAWAFVLLLISSRLPVWVAAAAGMFFLVHPANVEAVAMVFQLKTNLAGALAFGALLAYWRHPLLATMLFGSALLTKFSAAFALPVLGVLTWARSDDPEWEVPHWGWLVAWVLVLVAVAIPEFAAFERTGHGIAYDWLVQGRSIVAVAMRYLVMAGTSLGIGALQQPEPARTWGNPWFLSGVVALTLLAWRTVWTLLRREEEAAWWVMAVASFAPISQVFPFIYPLADRYLYTILPGLLGGALLAARGPAAEIEARLRARLGARAPGFSMARVAGVAVLLAASIAVVPRASAHTRVFLSSQTISLNSAKNYPDGIQAWLLRMETSARSGDAAGVVRALAALDRQGFHSFTMLKPTLTPVLSDPRIAEVVAGLARKEIERYQSIDDPFPTELYGQAQAQFQLGELQEAIASLERALQIGSPIDAQIRAALQEVKAELARRQSAKPAATD